jgi:hypothetical protein
MTVGVFATAPQAMAEVPVWQVMSAVVALTLTLSCLANSFYSTTLLGTFMAGAHANPTTSQLERSRAQQKGPTACQGNEACFGLRLCYPNASPNPVLRHPHLHTAVQSIVWPTGEKSMNETSLLNGSRAVHRGVPLAVSTCGEQRYNTK